MTTYSNSMTRSIDEHSIATRVRMLRSEHIRTSRVPITIVLVEGEIVDPLIYQGLFDVTCCHIEPTFGKKNAIKVIAILIREKYVGVIAIVDDDFDALNGSKIKAENIVSTDTHDIENLIIVSPALDKYLLYLLPEDKRKYQTLFAKEIRKSIIEMGLPLGFIRWYYNLKDIQADFSAINFRCFVDVRNRKLNIQSAIREILTKNKDTGLQENDLLLHVRDNSKRNEWWLICQGHDLIKLLFLILPGMLVNYAPRDKRGQDKYFETIDPMINGENSIVKYLAMCYERSSFEKTEMYSWIVDWETRNSPYCIMGH